MHAQRRGVQLIPVDNQDELSGGATRDSGPSAGGMDLPKTLDTS